MNFYTYLWLREDGTPHYVGKGTGNRAFQGGKRHRLNPPSDKSRILVQEFPDEASAFEGEKLLISFFGRQVNGTGVLWNLTEGGEGFTKPHTEETRRKISRNHARYWKGKKLSEQQREIGVKNLTPGWNKGLKTGSLPEKQRQKMQTAQLARWAGKTPEQRKANVQSAIAARKARMVING